MSADSYRRLWQRSQTRQDEDDHKRCVNPDINDNQREERPVRIGAPAKVAQPDPAKGYTKNSDGWIGDEEPDQSADDRCDHQRKNQHQPQKPREGVLVIEQERDDHAENHLDSRGKEGIPQGHAYRMPEVRVGKGVDVVLKTDHLEIGTSQREVGERIEDGNEERDEDADREQKRGGQHQVGPKRLLACVLFSRFRKSSRGWRGRCGCAHVRD